MNASFIICCALQSQENDRGKHLDNSSTQKIPETTKLRPAFIIEDTPHPPTQKSTTEDEKHGLTPMSSANAPLPNPPSESHLIPTTKDRDRESLLPVSLVGPSRLLINRLVQALF